MKRHIMFLIFIFVLTMSGCGGQQNTDVNNNSNVPSNIGTSSESGSAYEPALQQRENNIIELLDEKVPFLEVVVSREDNIHDLGITITGEDNITYFGSYIIAAKLAFITEFSADERGNIIVSLRDENNKDIIMYSSDSIGDNISGDYGLLRDSRSGNAKYTALNSVEDLYDVFPVASIDAVKSSLDENDMKIYEEVWEVLDTQYDRPEDEIFKELAPKYGMTTEELKLFISDMMEKIYQ